MDEIAPADWDKLRRVFDLKRPDFPKGRPFWEDASFHEASEINSTFRLIQHLLPDSPRTEIFCGQKKIENYPSSYNDHSLGILFYAIARVLKPSLCVEIGILHGFSLLHVASALRDNGSGTIHGFDLFEDYPYRHGSSSDVKTRTAKLGLGDIVTINQGDAFHIHERFDSIDLLHVDISNNGDVLKRTFETWAEKVTSAMIFEGGSGMRDQIDWMVEYNKPPILPALKDIEAGNPEWSIFVLEPFPSVTVALRNK